MTKSSWLMITILKNCRDAAVFYFETVSDNVLWGIWIVCC